MTYLILLAASAALLAGYYALISYETRRSTRVLAPQRADLDRLVEHFEFIATHVDFPAYLRDEARRLLLRAGHDIAHGSLQVVRAVERLLTHQLRQLRTRHAASDAPRSPAAREFVRTLSQFKGDLEATRPPVPEL